uniref:Uncharacterized protein n=1 Tax=Pyramimonas orientalis virus TaxID=455367 RepID=A0A7M3UNP4_POV01|nr:hypothetical protein HWQ62_00180 [Pyramimonas orientalis virus]
MITALKYWASSDRSNMTKNILKVIGAYGIIQVYAQDVGIRTGCLQARLLQNVPVQLLTFTAVAYSVTDDLFQSFSGTIIYFILKFVMSKGRVNDACFPSECEIRKCSTD